jgi:hypothetical protein
VINLGSYNYLGFAERVGPCATDAINTIKSHGVTNGSSRIELGKALLSFSIDIFSPERQKVVVMTNSIMKRKNNNIYL